MNQEKIQNLPTGHMIDTLQKEHEIILSFLDKLETVNQKIQEMNGYNKKNKEWAELKHIAEHLIGAEPHHQREEQILFPELERRGVFGPPQVMLQEHEELRKHKHELARLEQEAAAFDFNDLKKQLDASTKFLIFNLRDHIFKENNILYPTALEVISEPKTWKAMKEKADKIGYCCFTPKK
ncbi:MAG: hemerythrin domain-containing protein [Patescibacteria group bacterium]